MTYVDAAVAPLRKNGQIKLYGADALCGHAQGRAAGGRMPRHARPTWCSRACRPSAIDGLVFEFGMDHGAYPAT